MSPYVHSQPLNDLMACVLVLALAAALIVSPSLRGHIDDLDSQIYQVVARHMVEDHTWVELRDYVERDRIWREHLPFGLWPFAAAIRLWGEGSLAPMAGIFTLATIGLVGWMARTFGNSSAGLIAVLVLGTNMAFLLYGSRPRLDPLLVLLATAAAAPLLLPRITLKHWVIAALLGSFATLVKGPFGILPLVSAIAARAIVERSFQPLLIGTGVTLFALVPIVSFLVRDKLLGDNSWWNGYVINQLLASASGKRGQHNFIPLYPLSVIYSKFWPGLPLVLLGVWHAIRGSGEKPQPCLTSSLAPQKYLPMLVLICLFVGLGLCLPGKKLWHHALVIFPWLAVLAGVGSGHLLDKLLSSKRRQRAMSYALLVAVVIVWGVTLAGKGPRFTKHPCVISIEFSTILDRLQPGDDVLVVSNPTIWEISANLAAERRLVPWPRQSFPLEWSQAESEMKADIALVELNSLPPRLGQWREIGRARGWVLLRRD